MFMLLYFAFDYNKYAFYVQYFKSCVGCEIFIIRIFGLGRATK